MDVQGNAVQYERKGDGQSIQKIRSIKTQKTVFDRPEPEPQRQHRHGQHRAENPAVIPVFPHAAQGHDGHRHGSHRDKRGDQNVFAESVQVFIL